MKCIHIDTCMPEYLLDHHNRPGELLLQISCIGQDEDDATENLWDALCDFLADGEEHVSRRFPKVTEDATRRLFMEAVKGVDFRPDQPDAWFLLKWEV
jgi:hypothetical protein